MVTSSVRRTSASRHWGRSAGVPRLRVQWSRSSSLISGFLNFLGRLDCDCIRSTPARHRYQDINRRRRNSGSGSDCSTSFACSAATVLRMPSRVVARAHTRWPGEVSRNPGREYPVGEPGWRWLDADQRVLVVVDRIVIAPSPSRPAMVWRKSKPRSRGVDMNLMHGFDYPAGRGNWRSRRMWKAAAGRFPARTPDYVRGPGHQTIRFPVLALGGDAWQRRAPANPGWW